MMNIEKHRAFLDSLDGEKGLPEKMYDWYFEDDLNMIKYTINSGNTGRALDYLFERIRRAESRQIPDLKERVKAFGLACMIAEDMRFEGIDGLLYRGKFHALCEPEVKP